MLANNFGRVIRRLDKRSGRNVSPVVKDNLPQQEYQKAGNSSRTGSDGEKFNSYNSNRSKGIQCRECEGYGHIQK